MAAAQPTRFHASPSLKFFAGQDSEAFYLFREKSLLWKKPLSGAETRILGVADEGTVLVSSAEGLFAHSKTGDEPILPLLPYRPAVLAAENAKLGRICLEGSGEGVLVEKISAQKNGTFHQLIRHDLSRGREEVMWHFLIGLRGGRFLWDATRNLAFLAVAEEKPKLFPKRSISTQISLHEPQAQKGVYAANLSNAPVEEIRLGSIGTLAVRAAGQTEIAVIHTDGRKEMITLPSVRCHMAHIGLRFALLDDLETGEFYFKDFHDKPFLNVKKNLLFSPSVSRHIFFQENDDAVIAEFAPEDSALNLAYTTLQNLAIECQRWKQEPPATQQAVLPGGIKTETRAKQEEQSRKKRKALEEAIQIPKSEPIPKHTQPKSEIVHQLEKLKLQKLTGILSEEEAKKEREKLEANLQAADTEKLSLRPKPVSKKRDSPKPSEDRKKFEKLLEKLEERFIHAEISEKVYLDLKKKYTQKLQGKESPS